MVQCRGAVEQSSIPDQLKERFGVIVGVQVELHVRSNANTKHDGPGSLERRLTFDGTMMVAGAVIGGSS